MVESNLFGSRRVNEASEDLLFFSGDVRYSQNLNSGVEWLIEDDVARHREASQSTWQHGFCKVNSYDITAGRTFEYCQ